MNATLPPSEEIAWPAISRTDSTSRTVMGRLSAFGFEAATDRGGPETQSEAASIMQAAPAAHSRPIWLSCLTGQSPFALHSDLNFERGAGISAPLKLEPGTQRDHPDRRISSEPGA